MLKAVGEKGREGGKVKRGLDGCGTEEEEEGSNIHCSLSLLLSDMMRWSVQCGDVFVDAVGKTDDEAMVCYLAGWRRLHQQHGYGHCRPPMSAHTPGDVTHTPDTTRSTSRIPSLPLDDIDNKQHLGVTPYHTYIMQASHITEGIQGQHFSFFFFFFQ